MRIGVSNLVGISNQINLIIAKALLVLRNSLSNSPEGKRHVHCGWAVYGRVACGINVPQAEASQAEAQQTNKPIETLHNLDKSINY